MPVVPLPIKDFRGVNNVSRASLSGPGDLQKALNVDVDDFSGLRMRPGSRLLYPSATAHSVMTDGTDLLFREGADLKRLDLATGSAEVLRSGFTSGLEMAWLHVNDTLYYSDGEMSGVYRDRRSQSWGLAVPAAPTLSPVTGTLPAGEYQVVLGYVRNDGQESGASPETRRLLGSASGLQVAVAASSDPDVVGIAVYCSTAYGEVLYRQGVLPNQTGTTTITSRVLVGAGLKCDTLGLHPPPVGTLLEHYRGRNYIMDGAALWHTEPWRYDLVAPDHNLMLFQGEGRMLVALENGIWVGTDRGTMFLYGKDPHQPGGFDIRGRQTSFPPLRAARKVDGSKLSPRLGLAPGPVAVWPTDDGVFVGDGEGSVRNLTGARWVAPAGSVGTGFINEAAGGSQYLFGIVGTPGQGSGNVRVTINS